MLGDELAPFTSENGGQQDMPTFPSASVASPPELQASDAEQGVEVVGASSTTRSCSDHLGRSSSASFTTTVGPLRATAMVA